MSSTRDEVNVAFCQGHAGRWCVLGAPGLNGAALPLARPAQSTIALRPQSLRTSLRFWPKRALGGSDVRAKAQIPPRAGQLPSGALQWSQTCLN